MSAAKTATFDDRDARRRPTTSPKLPPSPSSIGASVGSRTSARTVKRSSTISQPMAIRPCGDSSSPRCSSARNSTIVLATDTASPSTSPPASPHPRRDAKRDPEQRRDEDLADRTGDGDVRGPRAGR